MLEILQYVTSGFWIFVGCTFFVAAILSFGGWAINAILLGLYGKKCSNVSLMGK